MATLRSGKQVGGSNGGGSGSSGEVDGRDRGAVQAADIKEKRNARTSKVVFGSLILDLLGFTVVVPLSPALLDCYSKHDSSGLYSSLLSCVTYYQHIISVPARFHSVLFWWYLCQGPGQRSLELTLIFATHHKHSYDSLAQDRKFSFLGLVMAITQRGNCQLGTHLHCDAAPWRWRAGCLRGSGNTRGSQRLASGFGSS
ncbi:hypothetical protein O3P69_013563 [Scylla paramamosain]|uniref:Uncharacterized protein n=1 Tax=Scylla paramamosain TaxID=85552 RepID=A0AAW0SA05_SCYPA